MELGLGEILLILFVALMVYGGRLPKVALAVGRSLGELKRGLRETSDLVRREVESVDPRPRVRRAWREAEGVLDEALDRSRSEEARDLPLEAEPGGARGDEAGM